MKFKKVKSVKNNCKSIKERLESDIEKETSCLNTRTTENIARKTLKILNTILKKSLGPYGSNTIIGGNMLDHVITKDGYTILKNIFFKDPAQRMIYDLVKKISGNLVQTVGDGSTSAIIIANALYEEFSKAIEQHGFTRNEVFRYLNLVRPIFEEKIFEKFSSKVTPENLVKVMTDVAIVALNNSFEEGKLIGEIYSKIGIEGFINMERSYNSETFYELNSGFEIYRGYLTHSMTNTVSRQQCILENPIVLMFDSMIDDKDMEAVGEFINTYCVKNRRPICIIANRFSNNMVSFFNQNITAFKNKNMNLPLLAIDVGYTAEKDKNYFNDLATYLGCTPYRLSEGDSILNGIIDSNRFGCCEEIISSPRSTRFISAIRTPEKDLKVEELIKFLENKKEELHNSESYIEFDREIKEIDRRINKLKSKIATLYIGGETEAEKNTNLTRFEDCIFACRSTIKSGYNIGGNLVIPLIIAWETPLKIVNEIIEKNNIDNINNTKNIREKLLVFINCIFEAFLKSFISVIDNFNICSNNEIFDVKSFMEVLISSQCIYNFNNKKMETYHETSIINSSATDIEIMRSSFSIIGLILSSNQSILTVSSMKEREGTLSLNSTISKDIPYFGQ